MQIEATGNVSRVVVGLDDSEGSQAAAQWCAAFAGATGAKVTAVHGLGQLPEVFLGTPDAVLHGLGLSDPRFHSWRDRERDSLQRWCAPLREAGVDHEGVLVDDDAVSAVLRVADEVHADLIVVGAHGHGGFISRLLGGVPSRLTLHVHVPVVIVPAPLPQVNSRFDEHSCRPGSRPVDRGTPTRARSSAVSTSRPPSQMPSRGV